MSALLGPVGGIDGIAFYNDSKSTTAASAILAIDSFDHGTAHAILGGYDKKSDLSDLARHAARHAAAIYTIGSTGQSIADAVESVPDHCPLHRCETLENAVKSAVGNARIGQVVLLSPGCASWDQFDNYERRGDFFSTLVLRYTTKI